VKLDAPRNWLTQTFRDPKLEDEYHRSELDGLRAHLSFSITLTSLVFVAYGVHDALVVPEVKTRAWLVRYALFLPVALLTIGVVRSKLLARLGQHVMLLYGLAVSSVVLYIGTIAQGAGFYLYTSYAVLFVTLGPFVARMNVVTESAYTLLSVLLYNGLDALAAHSGGTVRASVSVTLLALGSIGTLMAREAEGRARDAFVQRKLIGEHVEALDAEKQRSEALLLNLLPPSIAERLKSENRAIAEGFEQVSVLFADIVGFTQMSERLEPEEVVYRLNLIFSSFDDLVDKLKLEKIKTIGDAYMVAGGLHSREYDHAQTIAEMALAMRRRTEELSRHFGDPLSIRIGINTGPVVAGVIGKKKFIYDVWGDTVNTASRMESHSEPGSIQVSHATYLLLRDRYEFEPRGEIEVKGKGRMKTWFLVGPLVNSAGGRPVSTQLPQRLRSN